MSATTFISWCGIYLALCLLQDAVPIDIPTTKACYGPEGLNCTKHTIICNSTQKIAITDAYFTQNRECRAGLSHCEDVSPETVTVLRQSRVFDNAELISLFSKCSTKRNCSYQAPRRTDTYTFSVIKYRCIDGDSIIPIDGGSQRNASDTTIMYMHSNKGEGSLYTCTVQSQTPVNVTAFDVRLGDGNESQNCSVLIINTKHFTCSNVIEPYQQFERIQSTDQSAIITLQVTEGTRPVVWLGITSKRNVFISCNTTVLTRPTASTAGVTALMGSTGKIPHTTASTPGVTELMGSSGESPHTTDSSPNRTSVNTGAVVGTLIFVAVAVVLVWCWRKRKVDKKLLANIPRTTLDGQRNTSLSAANSPQQNNYDEIDDLRQHIASKFDCATSSHAPDSNTYFILETKEHPMMRNNGSNQEDEYNHLGQGSSPLSGTYDTTASAAKSVMSNNGSNQEDEYNHLGQGLSPLSGTYDTTASAAKSLV